jgi:hypothetical protein
LHRQVARLASFRTRKVFGPAELFDWLRTSPS